MNILGVVSNSAKDLNDDKEKVSIEQALEPLIREKKVIIEWIDDASFDKLRRALTDPKKGFHIFHYIGHGGYRKQGEKGEGYLILNNEKGERVEVLASKLASILQRHKHLSLAVLNSCDGAKESREDSFSSTAATLQKSLPAVIAMQFEISDRAAIEFSRILYEQIGMGNTIDFSLFQARTAIAFEEQNFEWVTPTLFMRTQTGPLIE